MSWNIERLRELRTAYEEGVMTDKELAGAIIIGILEGEVSTFEECEEFLSPELCGLMNREIELIEADDYIDSFPYVRDDLSDDEKQERALRLKPVYKTIFSGIKSYCADANRNSRS